MQSIGLGVDLETRIDGGFSVFRGRSEYDDEEGMTPVDKGLRLVQDVAFKVLPALKAAYNADNSWMTADREAFI